MTMKNLILIVLLASSLANAQIYQWKDANGKKIISDKPPIGKVSDQQNIEVKTPSSTAGDSPQKTVANREMDFRKRQQESQEKSDKIRKEESAVIEKKEGCERTRRNLELLESGERIAIRDEKGERSFMDDTLREREITKARQTLQSSCK
jgi:Domain of unknown function (DUF4124)